jgi:NAD(P)-dependent dehydrogenase (short-subunit alcohol dehydrogenase family)
MTTPPLKDKIALVTGAASGIGRATAVLLAREGASVVVTDQNLDGADEVIAEITASGGLAIRRLLDVTSEDQWQEIYDDLMPAYGGVDIVVNNAGLSAANPTVQTSLAEWRRIMSVNAEGVFLGTRFALRAMSERGGGSIVNVSSVSGIKPASGASAYCASKAAVRMFTRAVAVECADARNRIRVNLVTPAGVATPLWDTMPFFRELTEQLGNRDAAFAAISGQNGSQQFYSAEDVARTIVYLASDASSHLNGSEIVMDRGQT